MEDHWEFFPCQIEEHPGSVFYNHGISQTINESKHQQFIEIQCRLKFPDQDGLTSDFENQSLFEMEDRIADFIKQYDGLYVGRVTTNGTRNFLGYLDMEDREIGVVMEFLRNKTTYDLQYRVAPDPERQQYWQRLYPRPFEWQIILNIRQIKNLQDEGDSLAIERPIYHSFRFVDEGDGKSFQNWLEPYEAFQVQAFSPSEEGKDFILDVVQETAPDLAELNQVTTAFMGYADEFKGTYDGWRCTARKG